MTGGFVVVQSLSCVTHCDLMDGSTPGFPGLHYLREFAQTQVRGVGDAMHPNPNRLILCLPLLLLQSFLASEKRESIKAILVSPCPWRGGALALLGVPSFLSGGGSLTGASVPTGRSLEAREHSGVGDLRKFRGRCAARPRPRAPPPISPCWAPLTQVPRLTPLSPATRSRPSFPRLKDGFDEVKGGPKSPGRKED